MIIRFEKALKEFIKKFSFNPFFFFYEEDIRADLSVFLSNYFDELNFNVKEGFNKILGLDVIKSSPVKCEYPRNLNKKNRFDVAILYNDSDDFYNCDVKIAIEIKLGSILYDRVGKFKEDIKKLRSRLNENLTRNFLGVGIYFYQNNIDLKNILRWFPEINQEIREIRINDIDFLHFPENGIKSIIVTNSSIFILPDQV